MAKKKSTPRKSSGKQSSGKKQSSAKKPSSKAALDENAAGAPFNDQDPKRRLGNFGGAGEHPRQGGRTSGIVGQTKQKNSTDKKSK